MVYTKKRIGLFNFVAAALAAFLSMVAIWQAFDPRVVLFFVAFLAVGEIFVQIRWRLNIVCKECGFDPILFLKDTDRAAQKVKETLDRRKADPASLLKAPLKIQPIRKKIDPKAARRGDKTVTGPSGTNAKAHPVTGRLVSKQI